MLIEGMTYKALTSQSKRLYSQLKKETKTHKLPIQYSHIETARYEKRMNLLNVFSEQVVAKAAKKGGKSRRGVKGHDVPIRDLWSNTAVRHYTVKPQSLHSNEFCGISAPYGAVIHV